MYRPLPVVQQHPARWHICDCTERNKATRKYGSCHGKGPDGMHNLPASTAEHQHSLALRARQR